MRLGRRSHGRDTWTHAARRLGPPLFALTGAGEPRQGGFGWGGLGRHRRYQVDVRQDGEHGSITVTTSGDPHPYYDDWMLLMDWFHSVVRPGDGLIFPLTLRADRWQAPVAYDGVPYLFTFVGDETRWAGTGTVAGRGVRMSGSGATSDLVLAAVKRRRVREDRDEPEAPGISADLPLT